MSIRNAQYVLPRYVVDNQVKPSVIEFTILGSPQSKANSRRLVTNRRSGRPMFIRSAPALSYAKAFQQQCPKLRTLIEGDLSFTAHIFYRSRRSDLDESLLMDLCQGYIYKNDRQIKQKHIYHGLDWDTPRAFIKVEALRINAK